MKDTKNEKKDKHPVREHLSISYARWCEVNRIVEETTAQSGTWSQVLTNLSKNTELQGSEYVLSGAVFSENMLRRLRKVPPNAGVSRCTDVPPYQKTVVLFPKNNVVERVLSEDRLGMIRTLVQGIPRIDCHLGELLARIYSKFKPTTDPIDLVVAGFLVASQTLIDSSMGNRYTVWRGTDPEWQAVPS